MLCWKKSAPDFIVSTWRHSVQRVVWVLVLCWGWGVAAAAGIELQEFGFAPADDSYELSVNAEFDLSPAVEKLLERGVTLTFRAEVEVLRPRWYWFNERVSRKVLNYRLSYQTLTRHYRVAIGDIQQSYSSLSEALHKVSRIRQWPVLDRRDLNTGDQYEASFRYYLDNSQLPKPLQVTAFTHSEWELAATPKQWTFVAEGK